MTRSQRRELRCGLCFISPWVVGFGFFFLIPCVLSLYFSFCDYSVLNPPAFIGASNYKEIASDEVFWISLWNTLYFAALALPIGTVLALGIVPGWLWALCTAVLSPI